MQQSQRSLKDHVCAGRFADYRQPHGQVDSPALILRSVRRREPKLSCGPASNTVGEFAGFDASPAEVCGIAASPKSSTFTMPEG